MTLVQHKVTVRINATEENRWARWGLKHNPFPQIGLAQYNAGEMQLNSLDGDPVRSADDIRARLRGFDPAFIEGLIERAYRPGQRTEIEVTFPGEA